MEKNKKILMILGFTLVGIGLLALVPLYIIELPQANKDILSMGIGVLLGWGSSAVTYYFGSSEKQ